MKNTIFKIITIITICLVMVFSMCSFTTTNGTYAVYESRTQCDISYVYEKTDGTCYYGTIPSCNRILLDPTQTTLENIRKSIKFEACDMFMGNSTKSIDIRSFSVGSLPSTLKRDAGGDLRLEICYRSDDTEYSQLGTNFVFWNWFPADEVCLYLYDTEYSTLGTDYENFDVTLIAELMEYDYSSGEFLTREYNFTGTLAELYSVYSPAPTSYCIVDLNSLMMTFLEDNNRYVEDLGTDFLVNSIKLNVFYTGSTDGYGAVTVCSKILEKETDGTAASSLETMINKIVDYYENVLVNDYTGRINQIIEEKDARIEELETGLENDKAIPLIFDGIYKTLYNTLTIFFNMDFFGTKLGTIVGILLGAAVVIVILKVVL